jgi:hypothetical protein
MRQGWGVLQAKPLFSPENLIDPKHYYCLPDEGIHDDTPFSLILRSLFRLVREEIKELTDTMLPILNERQCRSFSTTNLP